MILRTRFRIFLPFCTCPAFNLRSKLGRKLQSWSSETHNKLFFIESLAYITRLYRLLPRNEILIQTNDKLCIGHMIPTHGHLLNGNSPPQCTSYQALLTAEHILIQCANLKVIQDKYYCISSLSELFRTILPQCNSFYQETWILS